MLHTSCSEFSVLLPSSVLSVPSSFPSLYLAPLCVPPRILSPSPSPPARSFPRTACSQHPLADWPVGIKGTVPPRSAWLYSSSATMLPSFPLLLRLLTVLYFHAASALCEGGETENTKRLSVIMLFSCCSLWQVSHLRRKRGGIRPHTRKEDMPDLSKAFPLKSPSTTHYKLSRLEKHKANHLKAARQSAKWPKQKTTCAKRTLGLMIKCNMWADIKRS